MPLVSVLLPAFNSEKYLNNALESVFAQSFKDWELIIVDDSSSIPVASLHIKHLSDSKVRIIRNSKNMGPGSSLNRGIELAKGKYCARIDADDVWIDKNKLDSQISFFRRHPRCVLLGTWFTLIAPDGKEIEKKEHPTQDSNIRKVFLTTNPFGSSTVIFKTNTAKLVGNYSPKLAYHAEDYDLWLRLAQRGTVANLPTFTTNYLVHKSLITKIGKLHKIKTHLLLISKYKTIYPINPAKLFIFLIKIVLN